MAARHIYTPSLLWIFWWHGPLVDRVRWSVITFHGFKLGIQGYSLSLVIIFSSVWWPCCKSIFKCDNHTSWILYLTLSYMEVPGSCRPCVLSITVAVNLAINWAWLKFVWCSAFMLHSSVANLCDWNSLSCMNLTLSLNGTACLSHMHLATFAWYAVCAHNPKPKIIFYWSQHVLIPFP
jgi:hypothetical protein